MKSLHIPAHKHELLERLGKLNPDSQRRWGKMTAHQMVCHLSDSFKAALGEKYASPTGTMFHRTVLKWMALRVPLRWPQGVKTRPEMDQQGSGTRPAEFAADVTELLRVVEQFTMAERTFEWAGHPVFGDMSDSDWQRWGYLHMDHHLRQFGL